MDILRKKLIRIAILAFALSTKSLFAQTDELQTTLHKRVEEHNFLTPEGEQWETEKKSLSKYSHDQIVRALVVELDLDRGSQLENQLRDIAILILVETLHLPPVLICHELDKSESPQRKASLMFILRGQKDPVVIQALLRQLKDKRPAVEPGPMLEGHPHALRVCDEAATP